MVRKLIIGKPAWSQGRAKVVLTCFSPQLGPNSSFSPENDTPASDFPSFYSHGETHPLFNCFPLINSFAEILWVKFQCSLIELDVSTTTMASGQSSAVLGGKDDLLEGKCFYLSDTVPEI